MSTSGQRTARHSISAGHEVYFVLPRSTYTVHMIVKIARTAAGSRGVAPRHHPLTPPGTLPKLGQHARTLRTGRRITPSSLTRQRSAPAAAGSLRVQLRDNPAGSLHPAQDCPRLPKTSTDDAPLLTCGYAQVQALPPLLRDEEVALDLWRAGRRDGRLAMPSHGPLTSTLTTTRCRRAGRVRTTPDR